MKYIIFRSNYYPLDDYVNNEFIGVFENKDIAHEYLISMGFDYVNFNYEFESSDWYSTANLFLLGEIDKFHLYRANEMINEKIKGE